MLNVAIQKSCYVDQKKLLESPAVCKLVNLMKCLSKQIKGFTYSLETLPRQWTQTHIVVSFGLLFTFSSTWFLWPHFKYFLDSSFQLRLRLDHHAVYSLSYFIRGHRLVLHLPLVERLPTQSIGFQRRIQARLSLVVARSYCDYLQHPSEHCWDLPPHLLTKLLQLLPHLYAK